MRNLKYFFRIILVIIVASAVSRYFFPIQDKYNIKNQYGGEPKSKWVWIKSSEDADSIHYQDWYNSELVNENIVYHSMVNYKSEQTLLDDIVKYKSTLSRFSLDCNQLNIKLLSSLAFSEQMAKGTVTFKSNISETDERLYIPDDINYYKDNCSIVFNEGIEALRNKYKGE